MKTAVSIPDEIFKAADETAKEFNYSRSELFTIAVKEFLEKIKSRKLLDELNKAYSGRESPEETTIRQKGKRYFAKKVLKEIY